MKCTTDDDDDGVDELQPPHLHARFSGLVSNNFVGDGLRGWRWRSKGARRRHTHVLLMTIRGVAGIHSPIIVPPGRPSVWQPLSTSLLCWIPSPLIWL